MVKGSQEVKVVVILEIGFFNFISDFFVHQKERGILLWTFVVRSIFTKLFSLLFTFDVTWTSKACSANSPSSINASLFGSPEISFLYIEQQVYCDGIKAM